MLQQSNWVSSGVGKGMGEKNRKNAEGIEGDIENKLQVLIKFEIKGKGVREFERMQILNQF